MLKLNNLLTSLLMPFFLQPELSGLPMFGTSPFVSFIEGDEGGGGSGEGVGAGDDNDAGAGDSDGNKGKAGKGADSLESNVKSKKGKGSGAADGLKAGEFDESLIPEEHKKAFKAYQQTLIDRGVDIGVARSSEKFEKMKGKEIEAYFKEQGLSIDDVETLKPFIGKEGSLQKLFEAYDTEDLDEIVQLIEAAEDEELSEVEQLQKEIEKREDAIADLLSQVEAIQEGNTEDSEKIGKREQKLLTQIENLMIVQEITHHAAKKGAYDTSDVVAGIKSVCKLVEGEEGNFITQVINPKTGHQRYNGKGEPFGLDELVDEFLSQRPHLRKSNLAGGVGAVGAAAGSGKGGSGEGVGAKSLFTKEQLKDPSFVQKNYAKIQEAIRKGQISI